MNNRVWESELFYCTHLGAMDEDEADIRNFTVKYPDTASGLLRYLQRGAFANEVYPDRQGPTEQ